VRPPAPGVPSSATDVTGIYRTVRASVLQLRADGDLNLTVPDAGASSGTYTLNDGRMELTTTGCGVEVGSYEVIVSGEQRAGEARLNFRALQDGCTVRRLALTRDPWVYADS
jgi:hypothetical protein